jgi:hypothetical protein
MFYNSLKEKKILSSSQNNCLTHVDERTLIINIYSYKFLKIQKFDILKAFIEKNLITFHIIIFILIY